MLNRLPEKLLQMYGGRQVRRHLVKLFILAAGKGNRLWPLTQNTPKSLIDFGDGTTILERQINSAIKAEKIDEVNIITGYKSEQIEAKVKDLKSKIPIKIIFNPVYDITNNLVSLWVAHHRMLDTDFMITNGDNIYINDAFSKIWNDRDSVIQITIDHKDEYDSDDMKVKFDSGGEVLRVHKDIPIEDTGAESVGLALIKGKKSRRLFVNKLNQLVRDKDYLNRFWLEIFNSLIEDGIPIATAEIDKDDWQEVDFHPDVDTMKKIVFPDKKE